MKYIKECIIVLTLFSLIFTKQEFKQAEKITFSKKDALVEIFDANAFQIEASYSLTEKYLYLCPIKDRDKTTEYRAVAKLYFQEYSDDVDDVTYLNSEYSTLDSHTGIFIKISDLSYSKANIFIIGYEKLHFFLLYKYVDQISFPEYYNYDNIQFNQITLEKDEHLTMKYYPQAHFEYDFILLVSKTSLRNLDIKILYEGENYTDKKGSYLFPNGYSFYVDRNAFEKLSAYLDIDIKNNNNGNEILLLGYIHLIPNNIFHHPMINGYQLYLEGNSTLLYFLKNPKVTSSEQYFTYQTNSIDYQIIFAKSNGPDEKYHYIDDFNSMFHYNLNPDGTIRFNFDDTPLRTGLHLQYLDYSNLESTQKLVEFMVTGNPKSLFLPSKASLYHFLPKERASSVINFYLRPRSTERMYVSIKKDNNCPENCYLKGKPEENEIMPFIDNIGLWYTQPTSKHDLQLLYVYCEKNCSYDIIMTYDDDPMFLYPNNNYTKFLGENKKDTFILPVYEDLKKYDEIRIDLTVMSGNAKLTFYSNRGKTKIDITPEIIGSKQFYVIGNTTFANESNTYYKKELFAVVEGDKNTFYNLIYTSGSSKNKSIENNKVVVELLTVPEKGKANETTKTFIFKNNYDIFYVSISTQTCQSNVIVNNVNKTGYQHNLEIKTKEDVKIQISLINDGIICNKGFKEEVTLFSYNKKDLNILLGENTLVNATFYSNIMSFTHIFKTDNSKNADNSFNIDTESLLLNTTLQLSYSLERISFNTMESKNKTFIFNQSIISNGNTIISSKQVNEICDSLNQNEICILKLNYTSSHSTPVFSVYLNKKRNKSNIRKVPNKTLVSSANSKTVQYYYIDLNKFNETEVIINSYEQDLEIAKTFYSKDTQIEEADLPTEFISSTNYLKITQPSKKDCGIYCRLYLAVRVPQDYNKNELFTTLSISYFTKDENKPKTNINLPLNYYSQYSFSDSDLNEVNYYVNGISANINIQLKVIKKNESDNSEVTATLSGTKVKSLSSSTGSCDETVNGNLGIKINYSGNNKPIYRLIISTIGKTNNPVIPIISSRSEKCKSKICYYKVDVTPNNENENAYFYVPDVENAIISIKKVSDIEEAFKYISEKAEFDESSTSSVERTNWYQYPLGEEKGYTLVVKVTKDKEVDSTLVASYHNKPNQVSLDCGEKRMFVIEKSDLKNIVFKINKKANSGNVQYKVNIHAIKGSGAFIYKNDKYPLGINATYKEDISIYINDKSSEVELNATNEIDDEIEEQDFVFSIDYTIETKSKLINKIENNKINSFKIVNDNKIGDLFFYMEAESKNNVFNDVSMNIKIYSRDSTYEIKSYINEEDFMKKIIEDKYKDEKEAGEIKTLIKGGKSYGELLFARLKITSASFGETDKKLFVYIVISQKSGSNSKVKVDLYPYNLTNNEPLAPNQLFVEKIPADTQDFQLLLIRNDIDYNQDVKISIIKPSSDKYSIGMSQNEAIINKKIKEIETGIKKNEKNELGKREIILYPKEKRYIFFNLYANQYELEEKDDLVVFRYKNSFSEDNIFFLSRPVFDVEGTRKNITFKVSDVQPKHSSTGKVIYIFNAYKASDINDIKTDDDNKPLYLFFSNKTSTFEMYKATIESNYKIRTFSTASFDYSGDFYFTCTVVVEDNEREEYLAFAGVSKRVESSDFVEGIIDYSLHHLITAVAMAIITLLVLGIMINICRNERKRKVALNVDDEELKEGIVDSD